MGPGHRDGDGILMLTRVVLPTASEHQLLDYLPNERARVSADSILSLRRDATLTTPLVVKYWVL